MITDFLILINMYNKVNEFNHNNIFYKINDGMLTATRMVVPFKVPDALLFKKVDLCNLKLKNKFKYWNDGSMISSDPTYRVVSLTKNTYIEKCILYLLLVIDKNEALSVLKWMTSTGNKELSESLLKSISEITKLNNLTS